MLRVQNTDSEDKLQQIWSSGDQSLVALGSNLPTGETGISEICGLLALRWKDGLDDDVLVSWCLRNMLPIACACDPAGPCE